jgi:predicted dehydrogenase
MPLRFGLLGTGYWARETHAAALARHDDAELVGVWGRDPTKAEAVAERYGVRSFSDPDALFAAVDAVAFALPPDVQAPLAVRAAGAGCHLLLEKPLALSLPDARRVVAAVEASGVASLVFFTARFQPAVAAWVEQLQAAGDWQGGRGTWFGSIYQPGSPYAGSAWRRSKGALWDIGPHALALAVPVLGPVERVTAATGPGDTVHLVLEHRGGASATLSLSLTVPPAAAGTEFAFYGPRGVSLAPPGGTTVVEAFAEAIRQLAAEVAAGSRSHACGARFGAEVVAVLDAAERFLAIPVHARTAPVLTGDATASPPRRAEELDAIYARTPPWDIGRPQPAFLDLARAGAIRGRVLDVGCGTGEHALLAAGLGLEATGVDSAAAAIEAAEAKARDRGLGARFLVHNALELGSLDEQFDTVLDSGLFHLLDDHDRAAFVDNLAAVMRPGGRYLMLCFSDRQPGSFGPRRVSQDEIRASFRDGWQVESIEPARFDVTIAPDGILAWLATISRNPSST